ncbi:aldehyde ferredoxin oxidoreductase family protein [Chloroflexota bacterium]
MASSISSGYTENLLRVDLTTGAISQETIDEASCRRYVGGAGLGAKILYEEIPPESDWSDPRNRLILATGPLGGTKFGGSGTFCLATKGALSNGATLTQANGFLGAYLKLCGFDGIIVQGVAGKWVYLYIHDGVAELRDASYLLGKDTWDTEDSIKNELGVEDKAMSVFCIGPAGENLVKFAAVVGDKGHVAAHNGPGAVMGSKKLKAIAVARGRHRISVHDNTKLSSIAKEVLEDAKTNPRSTFKVGTRELVKIANSAGFLPVKNYTTNIYPIEEEKLQKFSSDYMLTNFNPKRHPCWACQFHHCHLMTITEGPYKGEVIEEPDYESLAAWGPLTGNTDIGVAMMLASDVDRLGMDTNECGWTIAFAMECYEKGILTKEKLDGLDLQWGNTEAVRTLIYKIAKREGCGNFFANGVKHAAERLGDEALDIAIFGKKGNTPRGHDHRAMWFELFDTCVSNTGTMETRQNMNMDLIGFSLQNPFSWEDIATAVAKTKGSMQFEDSLGICTFMTSTDLDVLTKALNAVTGWDFTIDEAMLMGRRVVNLLRVFNMRCGISSKMDAPSPRYSSAPVDGPLKGKSIAPHWDQMLSLYYELMGWDKDTGKPLPETLKSLGLEKVVRDM